MVYDTCISQVFFFRSWSYSVFCTHAEWFRFVTSLPRRMHDPLLFITGPFLSTSTFARIFIAGNNRDGTGRYCFDMFAGNGWRTGRDGTVK